MITIPIEPYYDKLMEHYEANRDTIGVEFWDWIRRDFNGYQVYISPNPTADGEKDGCGIMFGEEEEATIFALRW
jgi:hypothetical protein